MAMAAGGISRRRLLVAAAVAVPMVGLAKMIGTEEVGAAEVAVTIMNFKFDPTPLTVPVGTTVVWTNQDSAAHDATSDTAGLFKTPLLQKGQSGKVTFDTAGAYTYYCSVHPNMKASVIVTAAGGTTAAPAATTAPAATARPATAAPPTAPRTGGGGEADASFIKRLGEG